MQKRHSIKVKMTSVKRKYCFVKNCNNNSIQCPKKNFFTVPYGNKAAWCEAAGLDHVPTRGLFICEDHLNVEEDLENYMYWKTMNVNARLKPQVPSLKGIFQDVTNILHQPSTSQGAHMASDLPHPFSSSKSIGVMHRPQTDHKKTQIKPRMADRSTNCCNKKKLTSKRKYEEALLSENSSPLPQINDTSADVTETNSSSESITATADKKSSLMGRNFMMTLVEKKPMTYIGIPKQCYWTVAFLAREIKSVSNLDIIVTLYKMRSNETFGKIADLFQLSITTLWRTYYRTLAILSKFFKQFIYWPPAFDIKRNLPNAFQIHKDFSKVQSIIDCFETETEKPSNVVEQSMRWSQYKSCNTAKYLISATPNGFINYISIGYGGRESDVSIVEKCGFMQVVPENCVILADRGFKNLETVLNRKGIKLVRPPSVFNNTKQTKQEVLKTKVIASLRVHIERVIRRVRMYKMLKPHAAVNNKLIKTIDDVVVIACGLINLQSSIIKRD